MVAIGLDQLADPVTYAWWWPVVGVALLVAGMWLLLAPAWQRRRRRAEEELRASEDEQDLRTELARRIDRIEHDLARGATDPATAALGLAHVARDWAALTTGGGTDAARLHAATGAELEQLGLDELAGLVRATYPSAFEGSSDDVDAVIDAVRRLLA